jgi:hypothetical protein
MRADKSMDTSNVRGEEIALHKSKRRRAMIIAVIIFASFCVTVRLIALYAGAGRDVATPVPLGAAYPDERITPSGPEATPRGQAAVKFDSTTELMCQDVGGRRFQPRVALAKLHEGVYIKEVNDAIRTTKAWKDSGSTWVFHPSGDYDFDETDIVEILFLFADRPDRLYPETARHIVDNLLIEDGAAPHEYAPLTCGLAPETENHILMREGARHLRNQWRFEYGTPEERANPLYDNARNGHAKWLVGHLQELINAGFYEFNSMPYLSFTLRALLNLEAFPKNPEVRNGARRLLDSLSVQFAFGSLDLRRCAPFRRQEYRAGDTNLLEDRLTPYMQVWTSGSKLLYSQAPFDSREETPAELLPYRPPRAVREWVLEKPTHYFAKFGHGPVSSPEIYSGGPGYLVSAGGAHRGYLSMIGARPSSLLLRDGATDLQNCVHLVGKGGWKKWNNTGVCRGFACSNGAVIVPERMATAANAGGWNVFAVDVTPGLMFATYGGDGVALLAVFPDSKETAQELAEKLAGANKNADELRTMFHRPDGGSVSYDLNAPKNKWVITAIDGKPTNRDFDAWPQMDCGDVKIDVSK